MRSRRAPRSPSSTCAEPHPASTQHFTRRAAQGTSSPEVWCLHVSIQASGRALSAAHAERDSELTVANNADETGGAGPTCGTGGLTGQPRRTGGAVRTAGPRERKGCGREAREQPFEIARGKDERRDASGSRRCVGSSARSLATLHEQTEAARTRKSESESTAGPPFGRRTATPTLGAILEPRELHLRSQRYLLQRALAIHIGRRAVLNW